LRGASGAYDLGVFERFTDRARRVVVLAQEEARLLNHNYIGTEHLLLGLLSEGEGVAARALAALNVTPEAARAQVKSMVSGGTEAPQAGYIPFTPRAKKALELSLRNALGLGHGFIGTEHILLGLVQEGSEAGAGVAVAVLHALGAEPEAIRQEVMAQISVPGPGGAWSRTASSSQDPPTGPLCPQCRALTTETVHTAAITIPGPDGELLAFVAVYCGMCGATYTLLPGSSATEP
jgi:ATP-dependent Clp protease ATP-binding subunit ClpA